MRQERALTALSLQRLCDWLDAGVDSHGATYLEMRRRLVAYFDRRNRPSADELADETLTRVGATLENGPIDITPPARYCYIVARFVLLEDIRYERLHVAFESAERSHDPATTAKDVQETDEAASREQGLKCLDSCLQNLKPDQCALVLEYYRGDGRSKIEGRSALAQRLGISPNALAIRASRIRDRLEACVNACRDGRHG